MKEKTYKLKLTQKEIARILVGLDVCCDFENGTKKEQNEWNKPLLKLMDKIRKQMNKDFERQINKEVTK